jgi:hypothetical protein
MTRMSKQGERRAVSPRRPRPPSTKTGSKKDNLASGYKAHENAVSEGTLLGRFVPKFK